MVLFPGSSPALLALSLLALPPAPGQEIQGKWYTDSRRALEEARRTRRPVLAVAMDHG